MVTRPSPQDLLSLESETDRDGPQMVLESIVFRLEPPAWKPVRALVRMNPFTFINDLPVNADPLSLRNQRGGGFMNGWTSQTDRAFYQMQYLTGHETDEMKMVIGNSQYDSHLDNQPVSRYRLLPRFVDPYG